MDSIATITTMDTDIKQQILDLKRERGAINLAHYYQRPEIQDLADYIGDSLALAQIATRLKEDVVVMCGVHFMAETVKVLCPDKTVLIPAPEAGCSLADSCPAEDFEVLVKAHPDATVISYVNTSAEVKALSDILVTSSNALKIVDSLPKDTKIIFGPDHNLGNYVASQTGRDMIIWDGACHVHEQFSLSKLIELKKTHPGARVLVHPECPRPIVMLADKVGSTAALLNYAAESDAHEFLVATESGILHQMQLKCPDKTFIPVPPEDGTCACNNCSYMKLITLERLRDCLKNLTPTVEVDPAIANRARRPIDAMLALS